MQADTEWGGAGGAARGWDGRAEGIPRTEKYDLKPYEPEDDDEYRTDAPREAAAAQQQGGGVRSLLPACACLSWANAGIQQDATGGGRALHKGTPLMRHNVCAA